MIIVERKAVNECREGICSNGACVTAGDGNEAEEWSPGSSWLGLSSNPQVLLTLSKRSRTPPAAAPALDGRQQPYGNASASTGEE